MVETLKPVSGKKPVVGLAGFFGYGNYGDELFVSVFKQYLGERFDLKFMSDTLRKPYFSRPVEELVEEVDAIVIGGGDIVQPWGLDPRYFSKAYTAKPVFVVGVGVPIRAATNPPSAQVEKEWVVEKYRNFFASPNLKMIHARDQQSANWIQSRLTPAIPVIEAPDIVCALDLPPAPKPEGAPILGIVTRQRPNQEDNYAQITALLRQQVAKGWKVRHIVLGTGEVGKRDVLDAVDVFGEKELVYSDDLNVLNRAIGECTALASMKFHGTVVATMYGVPSQVMIPTNKNRNFMARIERSELISRFDAPDLCAKFDTPPEPIAPASVAMLRQKAQVVMKQLVEGIEAVVAR